MPSSIHLFIHNSWGGLDLAVLFPLRTGRTENKCAGTPVLAYAGVLHLPRWCRQNSHLTSSKIRWRSTVIFFCLSRYVLIIIHIEKIWSLVKGIESTCILSFFFLFFAFGLCYFFTNQTIIA